MKILLGYDGSTYSHTALEDLSRAGLSSTGKSIVLVATESEPDRLTSGRDNSNVYSAVAVAVTDCDVAQARYLATQATRQMRAEFPNWTIGMELCDTPAAEALSCKSHAWRPDLIVLGAQGLSSTGVRVLGSVALRALCESECSVRIGRSAEHHDGPVHLMIALDGSAGADAAVESAATRHWPEGSQVVLLFVAESQSSSTPGEVMVRAAQRLEKAGLRVTYKVRAGDPVQVILSEAQRECVDCIFVGSLGCRASADTSLGDVAYAVAAKADCSVEVVKPRRSTQS